MKAQYLLSLKRIQIAHLPIVDGVTILWIDGGRESIVIGIFALVLLRYFPNAHGTIITAGYHEFLIFVLHTDYAGDGVDMVSTLLRLECNPTRDLHIPEAEGTILVAGGDEAGVDKKSHAAELTIFW